MSGVIGGAGSKSGVIGTTELDYEEGTWLPNLTDNASNALGHSTQAGFYTKIGNTVHISGQFTCNSLSGVTTTSDIYLRGLPFTIKDANGAYANYDGCSIFRRRLSLFYWSLFCLNLKGKNGIE